MVENIRRQKDTEETIKFLKQIEPFEEAEKSKIIKALAIAHVAHGETRRLNKKDLFVDHPITVASLLLKQDIWDADVICGALLHDVAEDTAYFENYPNINHHRLDNNRKHPRAYREYVEKVRATLALEGFSETTADIVVALTKPAIIDEEKDGIVADGKDFFNKAQAYDKKNQLLRQAEHDGFWEAILVKMADRIHNLDTFFSKPGKDTPWPKIQETFDLLDIFIKAPTKSSYPVAAARLSTEISRKMAQSMQAFPLRPRLNS